MLWSSELCQGAVTLGAGAMQVPKEFVCHLSLRLISVLKGGLVSGMITLVMSCYS